MSSSPDLSPPIRPRELAAAIAWLTDGARSAVRSQDVLAELFPDHEEVIMSARSLERLLTTLKPAQSHVIRLVKLQGLSIEEAANATGQSAALVKVNIHRGLNRLTSLLRSESDAR